MGKGSETNATQGTGNGGRYGGACYKGGGGNKGTGEVWWGLLTRIRSYEFTFGFDEVRLKLKII